MRKLICSILIAIAFSQSVWADVSSFTMDGDTMLVWKKSYQTPMTFKDVYVGIIYDERFKGVIVDLVNDNMGSVTCKYNDVEIDATKLGFNGDSVPYYISSRKMSCKVSVQYENNNYNVCISNIVLLSPAGKTTRIEDVVTKNGVMTDSFSKGSGGRIYDKFFSGEFVLKPAW